MIHDAKLRKIALICKFCRRFFGFLCLYGMCLNSMVPLIRMCLNKPVGCSVALSLAGRALSGGARRSLAGGCKCAGGWCKAHSPQQTLAPALLVRSQVGASLRLPRPPRYARSRPQCPPRQWLFISRRALRSSPRNYHIPANVRVKDY